MTFGPFTWHPELHRVRPSFKSLLCATATPPRKLVLARAESRAWRRRTALRRTETRSLRIRVESKSPTYTSGGAYLQARSPLMKDIDGLSTRRQKPAPRVVTRP